jgi:hypothetical protein
MAESAVFHLPGGGGAHNITINFLHADRSRFVPVRVLADSGSDITLLSRETGESIGFSPNMSNDKFGVGGVGAGAVQFAKFATFIKIERLQPVRIDFGVAQQPGALRDNLLGREDVLDQYNITFSKNAVTFTRAMAAMALMGGHHDGRGF